MTNGTNQTTKQPRDRQNGRYTFTDMAEVCASCGHRLGAHLAEAPHSYEEEGCERFKRARAKQTV